MLKKLALPNWYKITVVLGALSFLLFLAYRDEGYNNWSWVQDAGSWVFMVIAWNALFWSLIGIGFGIKALKSR